ncbi:MAG: NAD(P)-binding domain-containing protein [Negativicutes bacterium]|nr:NAD(P)-binding domain-containing protein [Negativicutes bacterium]
MRKVGFIGYGSMGSMLVDGLIDSNRLGQDQIIVYTPSPQKLIALKERYPNIGIASSSMEAAAKSDVVVICVKPLAVKAVLEEVKGALTEDKHLVSIAACVTIDNLERVYNGKITKVLPSLTSEVKRGISLVCHNGMVGEDDAQFVESLFGAISTIQRIEEGNFEAAGDLTSCAPGLFAAIFQEFVEAGVRHSTLTRAECAQMVVETLYGTAEILCKQGMGFEQMVERVATKGGITEEGVTVLKDKLPDVFDDVFQHTLAKHKQIKEVLNQEF